MSTMKENTNNELQSFFIGLPDDVDTHNILQLLRWTASQFSEADREQSIHVGNAYLMHPLEVDDKPRIHVTYWKDENAIITPLFDISEASGSVEAADGSGRATFKLNEGESQSDGVALLYFAAQKLEEMHITRVLDLILHDYIDDDGRPYPYVNVYFEVK